MFQEQAAVLRGCMMTCFMLARNQQEKNNAWPILLA
jgi:hypothetical protein